MLNSKIPISNITDAKIIRNKKSIIKGNVCIPKVAHRRRSTPYVKGLIRTIQLTQGGRLSRGKTAPLKKNMGIIMKLDMTPNPSKEVIRAAITIPRLVQTNAIRNINGKSKESWATEIFIFISGANAMTNRPSINATVEPLKAFPMTIELRGMGATRISRRKPNSLSQMILMVDIMAAKMRFMAIIPGKIKWG